MNGENGRFRRQLWHVVGITFASIVILTGCNLEPDLSSVGQGSTSGAGGVDRRAEEVSFQDIIDIGGLGLDPGDYALSEIDSGNGYELVLNAELSTFELNALPGVFGPGNLAADTSLYIAVLLGSARGTDPDSLGSDDFDLVGTEGWSYAFTRNTRLVWYTSAPGVSDRRYYADILIPSYAPIVRTESAGVSVRYGDQNDRVYDGPVEIIFEEPDLIDGDEQGDAYLSSEWGIGDLNLDFPVPATGSSIGGLVSEILYPNADGYTAAATARYGGEFDDSSDLQHIRFFGPYAGGPVLPEDDPTGPNAETLYSPTGYTVGLHIADEVEEAYYIDSLPAEFEGYVFDNITAPEYRNIPIEAAAQAGSDWTIAPVAGSAFDAETYDRYLGPLQSRGSHYILIVYSDDGYQPRLIEIDVPLYGRDIHVFDENGERVQNTATLSIDQTVYFAASEAESIQTDGTGLEPATIVLEDADTGVTLAESSSANGLVEYTFTSADRNRTFRAYATYAQNRQRIAGEPFEKTLELEFPADAIAVSGRADLELIGSDETEWPADAYYYLTGDIDLSSDPWTPLDSFSGTLHGNGYTITGLSISVENVNDVGLFSELDGAEITRLNFADATIGAYEGLRVGVLAGLARGVTVSDVTVRGEVSARSDVGGLIGRIEYDTEGSDESFRFERIEIEAAVSGTGNYIGGVVGLVTANAPLGTRAGILDDIEVRPPADAAGPHVRWIDGTHPELGTGIGGVIGRFRNFEPWGTGSYEVRNARSYVDVEGRQYVGAIVGQARSTEIIDSQVGSDGEQQTVSATTERAGAIAGYSNFFIIRNAMLSGAITVQGGERIGGLIGQNDNGTSLEIISPTIYGSILVTGTHHLDPIIGYLDYVSGANVNPDDFTLEALGLENADITVTTID